MNHKRVFLILLTTIVMFLFTLPVSAVPPQTQFSEFVDFFIIDCGDFDVLLDDIVSVRFTTFFDSDGNPDRFQAHIDTFGTVTHLGTGQSFRDHAALNFTGVLPLDEVSDVVRGISWQLQLPRVGMVVHRAGRIIYDENGFISFAAGDNTETPGYELLCEKLVAL